MYLYELALELDVRSADLVALAEDLGLPGLGHASPLAPPEVDTLRAAVGQQVASVPSRPGPPPAPAVPWDTPTSVSPVAPAGGAMAPPPPTPPPPAAAEPVPGSVPPPPPPGPPTTAPRPRLQPKVLPRATSRYGRHLERRLLIGAVSIIVIVVMAFGRIVFGGGDTPERPVSGASGADYEGPRVVFGTAGGERAVIEDLNTFCAGREEVLAFVEGARAVAAEDLDATESWLLRGRDQARRGAGQITGAFDGAASDESYALYDLLDDLEPADGAAAVARFDAPDGPVAVLEAVDSSRC